MENTYQANSNQNKAEVAIFIADKEYFRTKKMTRYKQGRYIMVQGSIHQEDRTILNRDAPSDSTKQHKTKTA